MKRRHIVSIVIVFATLYIAGVALAAQDRFTLNSPNGISLSQFKGYEKRR